MQYLVRRIWWMPESLTLQFVQFRTVALCALVRSTKRCLLTSRVLVRINPAPISTRPFQNAPHHVQQPNVNLLCAEDGDATSETSSYSDSNSSRPPSAEPDTPHKSLSRRQKRNLKKRPVATSKRKTSAQLQEWLNLQLTEPELADYLKRFLLTPEDMLSLGYPVETSEGNIIIFKWGDSPRAKDTNLHGKEFVLDVNAREFVPKSQRAESDSGHSSGASSGNTSDSSESFEAWEAAPHGAKKNRANSTSSCSSSSSLIQAEPGKKLSKNKQKCGKEPIVHKYLLDSDSQYAYLSRGPVQKLPEDLKVPSIVSLKSTRNNASSQVVQFPFYTFVPSAQKHGSHFKTMTFFDESGRSYEQMALHHPMYPEYNVSPKTTVHACARCGKDFHMQNGIYIGYNMCHYHVGRPRRRQGQFKFPCCGESPESKPCTVSTFHVWNGLHMGFNGPFRAFKKTKPRKTRPKDGHFGVYAVDCEMAYTDFGLEAVKVTVVGADGRGVYEAMIRPEHDIWDYNTYYSGITERDLANAKSLAQVQNDLMGFINADTILIGHGLENDLRALRIVHKMCIDTSALFPHHNGLPYKRGLKTLVRSFLNRNIQKENQPHNSYEDAASCMELLLWKVRNDSGLRDS